MTTFQFKAVQLLQLGEADNPTIQFEDGTLTISANRDGDQILITTPVPSTTELNKLVQLQKPDRLVVKTPRRKPRSYKRNAPRGEDHAKSKLKEEDIREMRVMFRDDQYRKGFGSLYAMYVDIANTYNVHYTTVYKILNGQSWRHVKDA